MAKSPEQRFTDEEIVNIKSWDIPKQIESERQRLSEYKDVEGEVSFEDAALSLAERTVESCIREAATYEAQEKTGFKTYSDACLDSLDTGVKWTDSYSKAIERIQKRWKSGEESVEEKEKGK